MHGQAAGDREIPLPALGAARPTCVVRRAAFPLTPAAEAFVAALKVEAQAIGRSEPVRASPRPKAAQAA